MTSDKKDTQEQAEKDEQTGNYVSDLSKEFPEGLDQDKGDELLKNLLKSPPKRHKDMKT